MATIGGQTLFALSGSPRVAQETLEVITRPNTDGVAYRKRGERTGVREFTGITNLTSAAAVKTTMATYKGMASNSYTVTDDLGNSFTNVMVVAVEQVSAKRIFGGSITHQLVTRWVLEHTEF